MPTIAELSELIERMATAFNGGSFANEYAKRDTVRKLVRTLYALKPDDLEILRKELGEFGQ